MKIRTTRLVAYAFCGSWAAFGFFFLGWLILASLKTNRELFRSPFAIPEEFQFGNYVTTWLASDFAGYFVNSALVVGFSVIGLLIVSVPAAYVLSRARFRGQNFLTALFVVGMGIPTPLLLVPLFVIMASLRACK